MVTELLLKVPWTLSYIKNDQLCGDGICGQGMRREWVSEGNAEQVVKRLGTRLKRKK